MIEQLPAGSSMSETADRLRRAGRVVHLVPAQATKEAVLRAFARALSFPAYFGGNLDALADCLSGLAPTEPTTIVWDARSLANTEPQLVATITHILQRSLPDGIDAVICQA